MHNAAPRAVVLQSRESRADDDEVHLTVPRTIPMNSGGFTEAPIQEFVTYRDRLNAAKNPAGTDVQKLAARKDRPTTASSSSRRDRVTTASSSSRRDRVTTASNSPPVDRLTTASRGDVIDLTADSSVMMASVGDSLIHNHAREATRRTWTTGHGDRRLMNRR